MAHGREGVTLGELRALINLIEKRIHDGEDMGDRPALILALALECRGLLDAHEELLQGRR